MAAVPAIFLAGCASHAVKKPAAAPVPTIISTTGVPACDTYLARYLACHAAAGIYPPDTLQTHYQAMRDTLLQEAGDPRVRPYLASRCQGLARQLDDTLQGRSCASPVLPASH